MASSNSRLSYTDVVKQLDQALASPRGIKFSLGSTGEAVNFKQRIYKFRLLDRRHNAAIYPDHDSRHGTSTYDTLRVRQEGATIILEKMDTISMEIEEL